MKGLFFKKPMEFSLRVTGESWHQGDLLDGALTITNRGSDPVNLNQFLIHLAWGELKKVRLKNPDAFEFLSSLTGPDQTVESGASAKIPWKFQTEKNAPITDKSDSLFLLYGQGKSPENLGQLQLVFHPALLIQEILKTFEISFRFILKWSKFSKGAVESKLSPPASKGFITLDYLILRFSFVDEKLKLHSTFNVRTVGATAATLDVKKGKKESSQDISEAECRLPSGRFNHEVIETLVQKTVDQIESKVVF